VPLRTAWRLCPQAVFLPVDFDTYAEVSARIRNVLRGFSQVMEGAGIDDSPLVTHLDPKSMSRETTFERDTGDWSLLTRTLFRLTHEVAHARAQGTSDRGARQPSRKGSRRSARLMRLVRQAWNGT